MADRPILFSASMVRALLDGRKTQTRRIVKDSGLTWLNDRGYQIGDSCPYGKPGDRLWVRETFAIESTAEYESILDEGSDSVPKDARDGRPVRRHVINDDEDCAEISAWYTVPRYRATEPDTLLMIKEADEPEDQMVWTPSIFMPRWASRITIEITEVRVQRLQEISEEDAKDEGAVMGYDGPYSFHQGFNHRGGFMSLWESINGKGSWDANPWVWALTFKQVQP